MNKRPLAPKFLNKLDNSLLINRPDTWSTRFHLVIYYCLLFMLVLTAICFAIPTDHREKSFFQLWSVCAGVLALIGFIVWLVYLLRFNVFKQFGTVFSGDRIKTFVLYFFIIVMMIVVVYIPPVVESIRADHAYSSNELATDMNRINELVTQLEHDKIPDEWRADTLVLHSQYRPDADYNPLYVDSSQMRWRIEAADSVIQVRPGMVIIYSFFDLTFVEDRRIIEHSNVHFKTTKELYFSAYKNSSVNPQIARNELVALIDKYAVGVNDYDNSRYYSHYYYENVPTGLASDIREKYTLSEVGSGFDHIADRKYRLKTADFSDLVHATYYIALVLTLLVFVFRHSTIKTFFLSLLVGVILSILSGLFVAVLNLRETGILWLMLFYFTAFVIISMLIFSAKKRSIVPGIALNAFVLMTSFIPIIMVALYYTYEKRDYYYEHGYYNAEYRAARVQHFIIAEFIGGIILLILVETLFKRLYRLWYASPED